MARLGVMTEGGVGSAGSVGENAVWTFNEDERWNGTSRPVILLPGHGGNVALFQQNDTGGRLSAALARTGRYACCSIQAVSNTAWYRQAVLDAIRAAHTAMVTRGCASGKYAVIGYSMNGGAVPNMLKRYSTELAAVVTLSGAMDLDWAYGTAGHTPVASPDYHTEIDASYGSYAATAGYRIADEPASFRGLGVPWLVVHPTDDTVVPYSISTSLVTAINDVNVKMRTPDITGDHTGFWANLPAQDVVSHLDSGVW